MEYMMDVYIELMCYVPTGMMLSEIHMYRDAAVLDARLRKHIQNHKSAFKTNTVATIFKTNVFEIIARVLILVLVLVLVRTQFWY
jgi:hypothetical protein